VLRVEYSRFRSKMLLFTLCLCLCQLLSVEMSIEEKRPGTWVSGGWGGESTNWSAPKETSALSDLLIHAHKKDQR